MFLEDIQDFKTNILTDESKFYFLESVQPVMSGLKMAEHVFKNMMLTINHGGASVMCCCGA